MPAALENLGPRRSRTRAALLDAGQRLFAERPVDAVSVDEIVLAAGVARFLRRKWPAEGGVEDARLVAVRACDDGNRARGSRRAGA